MTSPLKRSALFGLLGCVWAAFIVVVTFTDSLTDFVSIYDQAYHIGDYRVISAAWFLLESVGFDAVILLSFLVTLLVWLLLLRAFGFVGKRRRRPRRRLGEWYRAMWGAPGIMLRAVSVAASGYVLYVLSASGSRFLGLNIIPFYSFGFVKGLFVWSALEAGPSAFLVFGMFAFVHAVLANDAFRDIARKLFVPAAGVAAFIVATGTAYVAAGGMDTYSTIADAPGISAGEVRDTLYVLSDTPVENTVRMGFPDLLLTSPRFGDEQAFSLTFCEQNEGAVCRYLADSRVPSVQALSAYDYLFSYRIRRLDMPGLMDMMVEAWERTGEPVYWNLCLTWITRGAKSDERLRMLRRLTDETKYNIPGRSAIKVSAAYARYGDMAMARYWYGKGIATGRSFTAKDMGIYEPGDSPPFGGGAIRGRISAPEGVRVSGVGLIPAASMSSYGDMTTEMERARFLTMSISDGVAPAADGSFGFSGLPAGDYMIMLSIPGEGGYTVTNTPGVLTVSGDDPVHDVGAIEISGGNR